MANTLSTDLVPDVVAETAITVLQNRLASLDVFSKDFSTDLVDPTRQVNIPVATATSAVQENPTNFETGDTTVTTADVKPAHLSKSFHLTQAELNDGYKLAHQLDINLRVLANAILDKAFAPITAANFTNAAVIAATPDAMTNDDLKTLWGSIKDGNERNIVLDGAYYAQFLPTYRESYQGQGGNQDGNFGFDKFRYNNRFDGAEAGVVGFACDPQALAIAGRVPAMTDALANLMVHQQVVTIPDLGISVQYCQWASTTTRAMWASFDLCFGAINVDGSALTRVVTA